MQGHTGPLFIISEFYSHSSPNGLVILVMVDVVHWELATAAGWTGTSQSLRALAGYLLARAIHPGDVPPRTIVTPFLHPISSATGRN